MLGGLGCLVLVPIYLFDLPPEFLFLLGSLTLLALSEFLSKYLLLSSPRAIIQIKLLEDKSWELRQQQGITERSNLVDFRILSPSLIILSFQSSSQNWLFARTKHVIICKGHLSFKADSTDRLKKNPTRYEAQAMRRLRVLLINDFFRISS